MTRKYYIFLFLLLSQIFITKNLFAKVTFTKDENYRYIKSDDLPNHQTGQFPGAGNPNTISAQNFNFRIPLNPQKNSKPTPIDHDLFGVALNGVVFDPATAEFWNNDRNSGWNKEGIINGRKYLGIDISNAHVQPNGTYHYHGKPLGIMSNSNQPQLVGYAADGFPVYVNDALKPSYSLRKGNRGDNAPSGQYDGTYTQDFEYIKESGNLDECNGYFGKTKDYANGTYYYVISNDFPMIPRCLMGTSDESFKKMKPGNNNLNNSSRNNQKSNNMNNRPAPPHEAIQACEEKSSGENCSFNGRLNEKVSGTCRNIGSDLACVPSR